MLLPPWRGKVGMGGEEVKKVALGRFVRILAPMSSPCIPPSTLAQRRATRARWVRLGASLP
jgi:hypothetical protein